MRSVLAVAVTGLLGFVGGVLVGVYFVTPSGGTLALAGIAILATVSSPFVVRLLDDQVEARKEDAATKKENLDRFERHAVDLNSHAFLPLVGVTIGHPLSYPPLNRSMDRPGSTVLYVAQQGAETTAVEGLPNWPFALSHMLADSRLKPVWEGAVTKASRYYSLRESAFNRLVVEYKSRLTAEYGTEMQFSNIMGEVPAPWVDVWTLAWYTIAIRGPIIRRDFWSPGSGGPNADPNSQNTVSWGSAQLLTGRNGREWDAARLRRVFVSVDCDPQLGAAADSVAQAEREANAAISELSEGVRVYANRIAISHTFEGVCDVCRAWTPR